MGTIAHSEKAGWEGAFERRAHGGEASHWQLREKSWMGRNQVLPSSGGGHSFYGYREAEGGVGKSQTSINREELSWCLRLENTGCGRGWGISAQDLGTEVRKGTVVLGVKVGQIFKEEGAVKTVKTGKIKKKKKSGGGAGGASGWLSG